MLSSSRTTERQLVAVLLLLSAFLWAGCRPYMTFVYQFKPSAGEWKIIPEREDTLRAVIEKDGLVVRVLLPGRGGMLSEGMRIMKSPDAGDFDEQIVRIIVENNAHTTRAVDLERAVIETGNDILRAYNAETFDRKAASPARPDYRFTFGQKTIFQFALPAPDYLLDRADDTASKEEKLLRKQALYSRLPWTTGELLPGAVHAAYLVFPRLSTDTDYRLRIESLPALPFRIEMIRRLSTEDPPEIAEETRRLIQKEDAWLRRMNREYFVMHEQLRRHDEIRAREKTEPKPGN